MRDGVKKAIMVQEECVSIYQRKKAKSAETKWKQESGK